ncbi:MAG: alcohol dehydrogenase [Methanobacteriota archaeon]|nr:MAG: alcohol dehydrogenase [Euryarchaeota archaeon]
MRVAMYYSNDDIRVEEMEKPGIGGDEILVRVRACGICGSDVMEWYRIKTAPRVLGHEVAGEIVEVGEHVKSFETGQRVFVSHHVPCNTCKYCLSGHHSACETLRTTNLYPGGFSEYVRVPKINVDRGVFPIPENMSYEEAPFIEPLACVYRAQRQAGLKPGDNLLVVGSGVSGLLHVKLAKALGANTIVATDIREERLRKAEEFGAIPVNAMEDVPRAVKDILGCGGADIVFVCTGAGEAVKQALSSVDRGGTISFFAPPNPGVEVVVPIKDYWRDEVTITTSYAASPFEIKTAINLLESKRVTVADMITHRLPLEKTKEGFQLVANPRNSLKVIINP